MSWICIGSGKWGGGQRLENNIVSVLCVFNRSFHVVKDLCEVVIALLSLRDIVSGRQG